MKSPSKAKTTTASAGTPGGLIALAVTVGLMMLAVVGIYWYITGQDKNDKEYISLLGEQRVLSQKLTKYAGQVTLGQDTQIFAKLRESYKQFEHGFDMMKGGNAATGMPPAPVEVL